ncbi:SOS response-associated peptidase family protein [Pseudomonas karstica]|uniref:SOS response-associated peptidase family protein n=1 Tax=Pseudomonas karstica TaxID=1055468 RepID=UPI0036133611
MATCLTISRAYPREDLKYQPFLDSNQLEFKKRWPAKSQVPLERYNAAPTTQVALLHLQGKCCALTWSCGDGSHTGPWTEPINARVEKVAHGPFFQAIWPHRAITSVDNWLNEWMKSKRSINPTYFRLGGTLSL